MTYRYVCGQCRQTTERSVAIKARNRQTCECGAGLVRIFEPTLNVLIPPWFRAVHGDRTAMPTNPTSDAKWRGKYHAERARDV